MALTDALALWGAGLSTALGVFAIRRELRDRPRLTLNLHASVNLPHDPPFQSSDGVLVLDVANAGSKPATIIDADLALKPGTNRPYEPDVAIPIKPGGELDVIPPHGAKRYTFDGFGIPPLVHVDTPLRAYVVDVFNRVTWSEGCPIYRDLLEFGWQPDQEQSVYGRVPVPVAEMYAQPALAELTVPLDRPPGNPVEPCWKVWTARHLRR